MYETLGDYRLVEKLGEGAAGEVFLATPSIPKPFAKPGELVAIKRYKSEILRHANQGRRIEQEFRVGSELSHPNLVRIHEYVQASDGNKTPYLVMEYVDGIALDKWIEQYHPVPNRLTLRLMRQLIAAAAILHENGIIHRDIKPPNIMITSTFDLKLMDLGVVRVQANTPLTDKNKFVGTIRNSSPEMLFGNEYDARTDLYSIGTVLYALLHGHQVFASEDQFARLVRDVENREPEFDTANLDDKGRKTLVDVAKKLLSKRPADRHCDCKDVAGALEAVRDALSGEDADAPLHGYIATALTGLDTDARDAIMFASSKIAELAKCYGLYIYQPRKATDPLLHTDVSASEVYRLDRKRVLAADLLIVIANRPSFGVGQEIEIAGSHSIPTILLSREGTVVSRMVTGSPLNLLDQIVYGSPEELDRRLRESLNRNLQRVRVWRGLTRTKSGVNAGHKLRLLRESRGFETASDFAATIGVCPALIEALEQGEYQNVSLQLLERLAAKLEAPLLTLLADDAAIRLTAAPSSDANIQRLEDTARRLGWGAADYFDLRDDHLSQLAASGQAAMLNQEQWVHRHNVLEKRRLKETSDPRSRRPLFESDDDT